MVEAVAAHRGRPRQQTGRAPLQITFAASEALPFQKTGGLGDVTASLPKELARLGHRVELFIPLYLKALLYPIEHRLTLRPAAGFHRVTVRLGGQELRARVYSTTLPDAPVQVHLVDAEDYHYFTSRSTVASPYSFADNSSRFAFFSKVVAAICAGRSDRRPDVVHAHDWPTGLVPLFLTSEHESSKIATVFTVHNLAFTNTLAPDAFSELTGLAPADHPGLYGWEGRGVLHHGRVDMLKAGMVRADLVSTVSPTYAEEIQQPEGGGGYAGTLRWLAGQRQLRGILNGLDAQWRPVSTEPEVRQAERRERKRELQRAFGLPQDERAFLVVLTSRLAEQKGYQLLPETVARLRAGGVRLQLFAGVDGDEGLRAALLGAGCPEIPVRAPGYDEELTRRFVYPAADALLMPSRFEPCGLGQLIAQAHGAAPVVYATGGLLDTVAEPGSGFVFRRFTGVDCADALARAERLYRTDPGGWASLQERMMGLDRSWGPSAAEYVELYREAIRRARRPDRYAPLPPECSARPAQRRPAHRRPSTPRVSRFGAEA